MPMKIDLERITEAAKKLVELRGRMTQLDEERAQLQQQIEAIVAELSATPAAAHAKLLITNRRLGICSVHF